ncbi:MAG TPA: RnfABCDGE type electron transport complex subunit D [Clostridiales bacterium]|jgi:electron transport complex protein RnfD|nr:RnfABCDGE type electron transport complex subunit D [Clostridiales bacterium]
MTLRVSPAPHIVDKQTTRSLMGNVLISLLPTTLCGLYFFGKRAALVLLVSTLSAVLCELMWQLLTRKKVTVFDLSAAVTGLLVGLSLPSIVPLWMPALGSAIAIILVKQLFGGLGQNFMNPALFARGVLLASWPALMTKSYEPIRAMLSSTAKVGVDTVAAATPLSSTFSTWDLIIGNVPGAIGEVAKIAILLGLAYLLFTKTITWLIPTLFIGTVVVFSLIVGNDPLNTVLTGGVLFGAVFMATDYVTTPMLKVGQAIFSILCGVIVVVIRKWGGYPEGVTYAILFMNCLTPLIDRYTKRKVYGEVKKNVKK